jgi:hypothetical protein
MLEPAVGPEPVQTLHRKKQVVYASIQLHRPLNEAVTRRILQLTQEKRGERGSSQNDEFLASEAAWP